MREEQHTTDTSGKLRELESRIAENRRLVERLMTQLGARLQIIEIRLGIYREY